MDEPRTPLRPAGPRDPSRRLALVIDDDPREADLLGECLRALGHDAEVAYDGSTGLERARVLRPDVVFCELALAGIDGHEVARRILAEPLLAGATLVSTTTGRHRHDARGGPFAHHVAKPFDVEEIERVLAGAATRR